MNTTLVVAIALAVLVLIPVAKRILKLLLLRTVVQAGLKSIGEEAVNKQPDSIHVSRVSGHRWQNPAAAEKLTAPLLARGFSEVGDFTIAEMPDVKIRFLMNTADSAYACVYEHPKVGNWLDLVSRYHDGTGATFSTARDRGMEHRPQNVVVHAPELSPDALYDRMLKERPKRPLVSLDASGVVQLFEDAYREQIAWRRQHGISATEVAKVIVTRSRAASQS